MLQAGRIGIDETKAAAITAFLRPNPQWAVALDQIGNTEQGNVFSATTLSTSVSYLRERDRKRELRRESAAGATTIAMSTQADLERTLLFTLRTAFVQVLQAKGFRAIAEETFSYERGGASLLDFLQAEQEYRSVRLGYVNLVAAYLNAAAQLNLAIAQEIIQ